MLAQLLLILDDSSSSATVVDAAIPASAARVQKALERLWPRLAGRVDVLEADIETAEISSGDLVVSSHACGTLTDRVLALAAQARARVAVLPCCHDFARSDSAGLEGWLDRSLAIDTVRALNLRALGYRIWMQTIPDAITPKNRLLLGAPD